MKHDNYSGSCMMDKPMEKHPFNGDDYLCVECGRPRCLHYSTGFKPYTHPENITFDPKAKYRGPHPYFWKPGSFIPGDDKPRPTIQRQARHKSPGQLDPSSAETRLKALRSTGTVTTKDEGSRINLTPPTAKSS